MPVILDERMAEDWMNPQDTNPLSLEQLLVPTPSDLLFMQTASQLANNVKKEGPTELAGAMRSLFGHELRFESDN